MMKSLEQTITDWLGHRLLAGDINELTGDPALAMMAIGDDIKQASRYIQKRDDRVREAFDQLDKQGE